MPDKEVRGLVLGLRFLTAVLLLCPVASVVRGNSLGSVRQPMLKKMLDITWERSVDLPQGFQDSDGGIIDGRLITACGFCQGFDDAKKPGKYPRGFLNRVWGLDIKNPPTGWIALPDMPATPRQGMSCARVDEALYFWGGFNYTEPFCYRDGCKLYRKAGKWTWEALPPLPWPIGAAGMCAVGKKIYLFGGSDYDSARFTTQSDCKGLNARLGAKLLVFDTERPNDGWKRLADCPGTPRCVAAFTAVG